LLRSGEGRFDVNEVHGQDVAKRRHRCDERISRRASQSIENPTQGINFLGSKAPHFSNSALDHLGLKSATSPSFGEALTEQ
jgi:hypothetical protein